MRIISLLPSATETICALGLEPQLVGVTHECDYPASVLAKPKVTRSFIPQDLPSAEIDRMVKAQRSTGRALYALDVEATRALAADLIVTQTLCEVCAVNDKDVAAFLASVSQPARRPRVLYLEPTRLEDVLANIREVAEAARVPAAGESLVADLRRRIEAVRARAGVCAAPRPSAASGGVPRAATPSPPRVVVLEWLDPPFGCGHWTPDLVALAGAVEPLSQPGQRSREIRFADVAAADPDLILIACCGFSAERTMRDVPAFLARPEIAPLRAVRERRVFVTDGSAYFSRPGPRLIDSLELLAAALHAPGSATVAGPLRSAVVA